MNHKHPDSSSLTIDTLEQDTLEQDISVQDTSEQTAGHLAVLFICMGNICRSPTAEAIFRAQAAAAGLTDRLTIDSAGTHGRKAGQAPDTRAQAAAATRGYDLSSLRARCVSAADLQADYVLVMDSDNLRDLQADFPEAQAQKFMTFAPADFRARYGDDIPDPYFGDEAGFTQTLEMLEVASAGLVQELKARISKA